MEGENVEPLFRAIIEHVPAPSFDTGRRPGAGLQPLRLALCGRLAICRVHNGTWSRAASGLVPLNGTVEKAKITGCT